MNKEEEHEEYLEKKRKSLLNKIVETINELKEVSILLTGREEELREFGNVIYNVVMKYIKTGKIGRIEAIGTLELAKKYVEENTKIPYVYEEINKIKQKIEKEEEKK